MNMRVDSNETLGKQRKKKKKRSKIRSYHFETNKQTKKSVLGFLMP